MNYDYIKQGDCLKLMAEIPNKSIDMILCDLPYGTTPLKWDTIIPFELLWKQYNRIIKDNAAIVLFACQPFTSALGESNIKQLKYQWYWIKNKTTNFLNANKMPLKCVEDILVFYKKPPTYNPQNIKPVNKVYQNSKSKLYGREYSSVMGAGFKNHSFIRTYTNYPKQVLYFDSVSGNNLHPTQKPVTLLEYLIKTYTNEGEIVLDNCMGSGSTCVAAINTNRHYIGFELDENYFNIAKKRIDEIKNAG